MKRRAYCSEECVGRRLCIVCGKKHNHTEHNQISEYCLGCHPDSIRIEDYVPSKDKGRYSFVYDVETDQWSKRMLESAN